jgi:hypothetical protein
MPANNRACVKNQNNPAFKTSADNRANQKNPNHAASKSPKGKK